MDIQFKPMKYVYISYVLVNNYNAIFYHLKIHNLFQILVVQEVDLYTVTNFVADIGGYFGLLLGGSILSILESIFDLYFKFINVKTNKINTMNV